VGFTDWGLGASSMFLSPDEVPAFAMRSPILRLGITYGPP
jgi:hypothetical protein